MSACARGAPVRCGARGAGAGGGLCTPCGCRDASRDQGGSGQSATMCDWSTPKSVSSSRPSCCGLSISASCTPAYASQILVSSLHSSGAFSQTWVKHLCAHRAAHEHAAERPCAPHRRGRVATPRIASALMEASPPASRLWVRPLPPSRCAKFNFFGMVVTRNRFKTSACQEYESLSLSCSIMSRCHTVRATPRPVCALWSP